MVRLLVASASLTLAFAARINLENAGDLATETVDSSEMLMAEVDENNDEDNDEGDLGEPEEGPVYRCSGSTRDSSGRRRNTIDCGCQSNGNKACFTDDPNSQCSWMVDGSGIAHYCRRRRSAPRPAPTPPERRRRSAPRPAPAPPAYIPGNGRFWEVGSQQSSGDANRPGTFANGWYNPSSEFMLAQGPAPNHDGEPYPVGAMTRHDSRDPHHCFSGWAYCCNTEFNCCANCPYKNADRPEWGPKGFSQCLAWFPQCGTDAPHPNMPKAPPAPPPGEGGFPSFPGFGGDDFPGFGGDDFPGFGSDDMPSMPGGMPSMPSWPAPAPSPPSASDAGGFGDFGGFSSGGSDAGGFGDFGGFSSGGFGGFR